MPLRQGKLALDGRTWRFPLPALCCVRIAWASGSATYLCLGRPDIRGLLERRAACCGWTYLGQMGAGHMLRSRERVLTATTRRCASALTLLRFDLAGLPGSGPQ
jgi:hypothetical protein